MKNELKQICMLILWAIILLAGVLSCTNPPIVACSSNAQCPNYTLSAVPQSVSVIPITSVPTPTVQCLLSGSGNPCSSPFQFSLNVNYSYGPSAPVVASSSAPELTAASYMVNFKVLDSFGNSLVTPTTVPFVSSSNSYSVTYPSFNSSCRTQACSLIISCAPAGASSLCFSPITIPFQYQFPQSITTTLTGASGFGLPNLLNCNMALFTSDPCYGSISVGLAVNYDYGASEAVVGSSPVPELASGSYSVTWEVVDSTGSNVIIPQSSSVSFSGLFFAVPFPAHGLNTVLGSNCQSSASPCQLLIICTPTTPSVSNLCFSQVAVNFYYTPYIVAPSVVSVQLVYETVNNSYDFGASLSTTTTSFDAAITDNNIVLSGVPPANLPSVGIQVNFSSGPSVIANTLTSGSDLNPLNYSPTIQLVRQLSSNPLTLSTPLWQCGNGSTSYSPCFSSCSGSPCAFDLINGSLDAEGTVLSQCTNNTGGSSKAACYLIYGCEFNDEARGEVYSCPELSVEVIQIGVQCIGSGCP